MTATEVGPEALMQLAVQAVNRGDLAESEALCRRVLAVQDHGGAYRVLGFIAFQRRQYEEAVANCAQAAARQAGGWHNLLLLGAARQALGRLPEAREALAEAARLNPGHVETALRLLDVALRLEGLAAAEGLYRQAYHPLAVREIDEGWEKLVLRAVGAPPTGVRTYPQDTAFEWARRAGVATMDAGDIEAIPIQAIGAAAPTGQVMGNKPYVVELPHVRAFAYSHVILTADDVALNEAGGHRDYGRFVDHRSDAAVVFQHAGRLRLRDDAYEMQDVDAAVWLAGPASDAFGHWIGEFAPRLQFLEQHPAFAGRPILVDEGMPPTHLELLRMICSNPLITLRRGQGVRVRRLLYAPTPTFFPIHLLPNDMPPFTACCASVRAYRYLKEKAETALGVAPPTGRKYYLTRAARSWRRIRNEDEVRGYLERHGYETVLTENLTFAEQVRLFQSAGAIMAPSGSAMQNFVYAPTNVRLFVMTQENPHNHAAFNGQARAMGYDPQFICGRAVGDPAQKHTDYVIPIEALAPAVA
ncbi:glycosyltransferase family 61 protein [Phenylobacterium sp.]|uniref:glycosyltransferase family 61 protein n=1 Tax=Phenylobacterium sp. TaxID=1871053 RepID=UPI0025F07039|nr:glycosyltransferase family 61 protein [Phenylobacterium sp.]